MSWLLPLLGLIVAYFVGAFPSGLVVGKAFAGTDIRQHGSGNIGFTNALRVLGARLGILVLVLDVGKALGAVLLLPSLFPQAPVTYYDVLVGCAVIAGNMFNVFLGFKGGKGVAAGFGVFLALAPWVTLLALAVFIVAVALTRFVSLGSLLASLTLPIGVILTRGPGALLVFTVLVAAGVILKHRGNIRRLMRGEENRFGQKVDTSTVPGSE